VCFYKQLLESYGYCIIGVLAGCHYMTKHSIVLEIFILPVNLCYVDVQLEDTFMQDLWDISLRFV